MFADCGAIRLDSSLSKQATICGKWKELETRKVAERMDSTIVNQR